MGYAISCGHDATAQSAEIILQNGGNAIDAAIAAITTSWVAEPCMSGPGGGAFATVLSDGEVFCLDAFANTPGSKRPPKHTHLIPIEVDFGNAVDLFYTGYGSCAIPGVVKGIFDLHKIGGSVPMNELMLHAIQTAKDGVAINAFQYYDFYLLKDIIAQSARGREIFFEGDTLLSEGSIIKMPQLADFMDYLSNEGPDAFYQGEVASSIVSDMDGHGGNISMDDLKHYQTVTSRARRAEISDHILHTQHAPSIGGLMLCDHLHFLNKSLTYDPARIVDSLQYLRKRKEEGYYHQDQVLSGGLKKGGTSHINIIDGYGNAISMSMSIGEGSGCFVKGTDIHLNNMLGEESLLPNGIHSWLENSRMASMMSPSIIMADKKSDVTCLGSGGASRIPTMIGQVVYHLTHGKANPTASVEYPRIHLSKDIWEVEPGFPKDPSSNLRNWNEWDKTSLYFGGVHIASKRKNQFEAFGDPRRDGVGRSAN